MQGRDAAGSSSYFPRRVLPILVWCSTGSGVSILDNRVIAAMSEARDERSER